MHENSETPTPSLYRDKSFFGILITQFLGAFNDNVFKQILLYICIDMAQGNRAENMQGTATVVFAIPFILLSGLCGYLSDIVSKRNIIVLSKVLEIVAMALGGLAFASGNVSLMLGVLFFMGAQSALFGPAKYGILPELFRDRDLPRANGIILMTTFLSIIVAYPVAGEIKEALDGELWKASVFCIVIAVIGTLSSLWIRHTSVASPDAKFDISTLAVNRETAALILKDRRLLWTLVATSVFWTTGGVVYPNATNDLGMLQFQWGEAATGRLAACTGIGIAVGCLVAGYLSKSRFDARLVRGGAIGMLVGLLLLAIPGSTATTVAIGIPGTVLALMWLGFCAGLFTVPLQVLLQGVTPNLHKGRIIGVMNLANWIGMGLAGVYYQIWNGVFASESFRMPYNAMFGAAALLLVPLVLLYRPKSLDLNTLGEESQAS